MKSVPLLSSQLPLHIGEIVIVAGWVHRVRQIGALTFLILRDGAGLMQVVFATASIKMALTAETVVEVEGRAVEEERAPGGIEIHDPSIGVLSCTDETPPVYLGAPELDSGLEQRLRYAPISLRHPAVRSVFRVQAALVSGFRRQLDAAQFIEVHTPKLIATASESGANVFPVSYFGRTAYLAQSPQLYKQMMVGVFGRVFEVGPVFRAEPHATGRHLSEYVSLDAEMGFIADHRTVMALLRDVLSGMLDAARGADPVHGPSFPEVPREIPSIHFAEALELVSEGLKTDLRGEPDLAPAHEAWLGSWAQRTFGSEFLFVEGYPTSKRPFYTHPDPARPDYTLSFDLLFRGQEIVTGGQRLHRYVDYVEALQRRGLSAEGLEGYLMAFRWGMPPHGGFAIGLERLTARLLNLKNIREASLFPRDQDRLVP